MFELATSKMSRAEKVHAETPQSRNRVVDLLRALAIGVVVFGHWSMIAVEVDGGIEPHGVLDRATWTHPVTWIFQVMPIFFLVGGYSNGISWRSARKKGHNYATWLRARLRRLGIPLLPLMIAWLVIGFVAVVLGADKETVQFASQMALIPTWFLAAYLVVILMAPPCLVLWEKYGWWSIIGGIALAEIVDAVSIVADNTLMGYPNYLLVWSAFHQFGYAWLDGRLATTTRRLILAVIGLAGLLLLVSFGPYPVSMISTAGEAISNSAPTRVTMAFLGMLQAGVVLMLEKPLAALLQKPRVWYATVLVNLRIMTWFLWHLTAMVGLAHVLIAIGNHALLPEPLTLTWWLTRPLWCLVLLGITAVFVVVLGRFESPRPDPRPAPALWQPLLAAASIVAGLAVMANMGVVDDNGVTFWPLLPLAGMLLSSTLILPHRGAKKGN